MTIFSNVGFHSVEMNSLKVELYSLLKSCQIYSTSSDCCNMNIPALKGGHAEGTNPCHLT